MNEKVVELLRELITDLEAIGGCIGVGVIRQRLLKIIHELL